MISSAVGQARTAKDKFAGEVMSDTDCEESDSGSGSEEDASWISWFCSLKGNEFFCEVDEDYVQDDFNLSGLSAQVPYYEYALDLILDVESPSDECEDVYHPRSKVHKDVDGAYFGTTFPHLLLMTYPVLRPQRPSETYVPR
eukprot:scaffold344684_cov45-Prasinocladus_malaysianus.AAC.1